jgi:hypothetical protein
MPKKFKVEPELTKYRVKLSVEEMNGLFGKDKTFSIGNESLALHIKTDRKEKENGILDCWYEKNDVVVYILAEYDNEKTWKYLFSLIEYHIKN